MNDIVKIYNDAMKLATLRHDPKNDSYIKRFYTDKPRYLSEKELTNLNREALKKELRNYWNSAIHEELQDIVYYILKNKNIASLSNEITTFKAISTDSAEGNVFLGGVQHIDKILIIKYNKIDIDSIKGFNFPPNITLNISNDFMKISTVQAKHEFVVGDILNNLKSEIPNFLYTYGSTSCLSNNSPIRGQTYEMCKGTSPAIHNIIEFVEGKPLEDMLPQLSYEEIGKIFLAMFCSLQIANERYGFCHYDFHHRNVMIREEKRPISLVYQVGGEEVIVNTKYVPVIIDYGFARIEYNGVLYSRADSTVVIDKFPNLFRENHPYVDFFKMIATCIMFSYYGESKYQRKIDLNLFNFLSGWVEDLKNVIPLADQRILNACLRSPSSNLEALELLQQTVYYPRDLPQNPTSFATLKKFLLKFRSESRISIQKQTTREEIKLRLYPVDKKLCNGEFTSGLNKEGKYRSIFECVEYTNKGFDCFATMKKGMVIYNGSEDVRDNFEYPFGKIQRESINLTEDEKAELELNPTSPESKKILAKYQFRQTQNYGDLEYAQEYSKIKLKCGTLCTYSYRFKKDVNLLNASDPITLYNILRKTDSFSFKFITSINYGAIYSYNEGIISLMTSTPNRILELLDNQIFRSEVTPQLKLWIDNFLEFSDVLSQKNIRMTFVRSIYMGAEYKIDDVVINQNTLNSNMAKFKQITSSKDNPYYNKVKTMVKNFLQTVSRPTENQLLDIPQYVKYIGYKLPLNNRLSVDGTPIIKYCRENKFDGYLNLYSFKGGVNGVIKLYDNVKDILERNYQDPYDWQFADDRYIFGEIGKLIKDMKNYKTVDIENEAGNLLEHSIWTTLNVQHMFKVSSKYLFPIIPQYPVLENIIKTRLLINRKAILLSAFLHDIGKAGDRNLVYYKKQNKDVEQYFKQGYKTISDETINLYNLIQEVGIPRTYISGMIKMIQIVDVFEETLKNERQELTDVQIDELLGKIFALDRGVEFQDDGLAVLIAGAFAIFIANYKATYFSTDVNIKELRIQIEKNPALSGYYFNEYVEEFPFITNVPRVNPGRMISLKTLNEFQRIRNYMLVNLRSKRRLIN